MEEREGGATRRILEDLRSHRGRAAEIQKAMRGLSDEAISEIVKMQAIRSRLEWLHENAAKASGPDVPSGDDKAGPNARQLDWELEKLHVIQRMLGASPPETYSGETSPQAAVSPASPKKRILVVDDDPITVNIVTHFLRKDGFEPLSSLSGVDGLRLALRENLDLIVLDILMPDLSGFQFLTALRRAKRESSAPVIILSSLSADTDVLKGLEFGAADYVTKPFSPLVLMARIRKALEP